MQRALYKCKGCGVLLRPKHGDCCVFCSYGTVPCPPVQEAHTTGGWRGHVHEAERRRVRRKPASEMSVYEHYLLCVHHEQTFDEENTHLGIYHGEQAAELDPEYARTWLMLWFL